MNLTFDITSNTEITDSILVKVVKLSYSMGCLTVLIAECEHNIKILSDSTTEHERMLQGDEFKQALKQNLHDSLLNLQKYKSQKETIEHLLAEEIGKF